MLLGVFRSHCFVPPATPPRYSRRISSGRPAPVDELFLLLLLMLLMPSVLPAVLQLLLPLLLLLLLLMPPVLPQWEVLLPWVQRGQATRRSAML